jgi:hypothetical protein
MTGRSELSTWFTMPTSPHLGGTNAGGGILAVTEPS